MTAGERPDRNNEIYKRRAAGETLEAIAADYGITDERVRQIHHLEARKRRPPGSAVTVLFTDPTGVQWQIYDFDLVNDRRSLWPVGCTQATHRAFRRLDRPGVARTYSFIGAHEDRALYPWELARQLARSRPATRHVAALKPVKPAPFVKATTAAVSGGRKAPEPQTQRAARDRVTPTADGKAR